MRGINDKEFSLLELFIEVAILIILAGLLAQHFTKCIERDRWAKAIQTLDNIYFGLEVVYTDVPQKDKDGHGEWICI